MVDDSLKRFDREKQEILRPHLEAFLLEASRSVLRLDDEADIDARLRDEVEGCDNREALAIAVVEEDRVEALSRAMDRAFPFAE